MKFERGAADFASLCVGAFALICAVVYVWKTLSYNGILPEREGPRRGESTGNAAESFRVSFSYRSSSFYSPSLSPDVVVVLIDCHPLHADSHSNISLKPLKYNRSRSTYATASHHLSLPHLSLSGLFSTLPHFPSHLSSTHTPLSNFARNFRFYEMLVLACLCVHASKLAPLLSFSVNEKLVFACLHVHAKYPLV